MEYPLMRRNSPTSSSLSTSPRLVRSRSGSENNSISINISQRFTSQRYTSRSKSTTRSSRNIQNEENIKSSSTMQKKQTGSQKNCSDDNRDGFVRFLQRASPRNSQASNSKMVKSTLKSPSAWALSPGRSLFNVFPSSESPTINGGGERGNKVKSVGGGAVSGVLKFFKQKKVSSLQEEDYNKFKVSYNRLLQWRFANAKAEASMASMKIIAEDRLFNVWLRTLNLRNTILEKRIQILKQKHEHKLRQIVKPQINLLNEWAKIERKNIEAVGRVNGKVSALSVKLPLVEEAMGDVESIQKAINSAMEVMTTIEATITKLFSQVENLLYLLTELTSTIEHQNESLEEMKRIVILVAELLAWEKSIRVQLIQVVDEPKSKQVFEFLENTEGLSDKYNNQANQIMLINVKGRKMWMSHDLLDTQHA